MQYYSFERISPKRYFRQYPVTAILILLNVIIFILELMTGGISGLFLGNTTSTLAAYGGLYPPAVQEGEWWRLITSIFLHSGLLHILCNILTLYSVGVVIETEFERWQYLLIYFGSGLAGGLMTYFLELSRGSYHLTVGASGAIFGLFGALLGYAVRNHDGAYVHTTLLNIVWMMIPGFLSTGVSVSSHIGGVLGGFLLGLLLTRKSDTYFPTSSHKGKKRKKVDYSANPWEYTDHDQYFHI